MNKVITDNNGNEIRIYGNGHLIPIDYDNDGQSFFMYKKRKYYLDDFMSTKNTVWSGNIPEWLKNFDGYNNDSFFSGLLVKFDDSFDCVQVFTFIS